jgi:pimeloyl-ACP methyl ester carboxylesterase
VQADVPIAVVEWEGAEPPILYAHATGFHKWLWHKIAARVGRRALAFDVKGHGDSGKPDDDSYHWSHFAGEVLAVIDALDLATPLDAAGHSMGAATLLLAELERPGTFRRIVAFEPIVFPTMDGGPPNPLVDVSRRRRMVFASPEDAAANYLSKPPMERWDPEVMSDYVSHGMRPRPDGQWELKCPGRIEAKVYENSSTHDAWDRLGEITCPVLVVRGDVEPLGMPGELAEEQARRLANARATSIEGAGHFAPMEKPGEAADLIAGFLARDD